MKQDIDYIYVPKADINDGVSSRVIIKAALYFTKDYLFVLHFQRLQVLMGAMDPKSTQTKDFVDFINQKIPKLDTSSFYKLMFNALNPNEIYHIQDLEKFEIKIGFWIFGRIQIKRKGIELQVFTVQPKALREKIKRFYYF